MYNFLCIKNIFLNMSIVLFILIKYFHRKQLLTMTLVVLLKGYLDKKGFNDTRICANNLSFQNLKDNPSWTKMFLLFLFLSISQFSFYFHRAFCSLNSFFSSSSLCSLVAKIDIWVWLYIKILTLLVAWLLESRHLDISSYQLNGSFSWRSAKQTSVAALIIEAKFISCFEATSQAI